MLTLPDGMTPTLFLREYWQKTPLLLRAALPIEHFSTTPDELAGLACEEIVESRLIVQHGSHDWALRHGPFDAKDFADLPEQRWTLLVQDVDKYLPTVAALIDAFDFLPDWRIDDIMVSYAADQGGVGPHSDAYDVFLMQGMGRRRWRLSLNHYSDEDLLSGSEHRVLTQFQTDEEWLLEAGDVLYLPPGVAHWGIAEGQCMTYSLGFRSPSQQDLAADWFQHLVGLASQQPLVDRPDRPPSRRAELTTALQSQTAALLSDLPAPDSEEFKLWLGRYLTEPKPQFQIAPADPTWSTAQLRDWIAQGGGLDRHPFARLLWGQLGTSQVALFYQGEECRLPATLSAAAHLIAERRSLNAGELQRLLDELPDAIEPLLGLANAGVLEPSTLT